MAEKTPTKQFLRIFSTAVEGNLPVVRSLLKIKGIGKTFSLAMCRALKLDPKTLSGDLTDVETKKIEQFVASPQLPTCMLNRRIDFETGKNKHLILANLKLKEENDIKRLKRIKAYKGVRHTLHLPVRGQRTRAHFRKGSALGVKRPKKRGK